jgi:hypothetical protein
MLDYFVSFCTRDEDEQRGLPLVVRLLGCALNTRATPMRLVKSIRDMPPALHADLKCLSLECYYSLEDEQMWHGEKEKKFAE